MKNSSPRILAGEYLVLKHVWQGHLSTIFKCVAISTREVVAVKVLNPLLSSEPDMVRRFEREYEILKRLQHRQVVKAIRLVEDRANAGHCMVLEYIDGTSIRPRLRRGQAFTLGDTICIAQQLCSILSYIHGKKVVHRDIQPSNVMICGPLQVKLLDFNIAQVPAGFLNGVYDDIANSEHVAGTAAYMAPEQIRGEHVDGRADIYSLGCMMYEMVTGKTPFIGSSYAVLYKQLNAEPMPPSIHNPAVPSELDHIILTAMRKRVEDRYQSAQDLQAELSKVLDRL